MYVIMEPFFRGVQANTVQANKQIGSMTNLSHVSNIASGIFSVIAYEFR